MKLLSLETSCDECSAAIVTLKKTTPTPQVEVLSLSTFSQIELHQKFGGVVPEIASRNHVDQIPFVVHEALKSAHLNFSDLSAIAVTNRPGLIGALLVGVSYAKALAYQLNIPLIPVHHLEGHLHSLFLADQPNCAGIEKKHLPMLIALVSGGHTILYLAEKLPPENLTLTKLAESRDDASGEAFDKTAKLLGLPYPGGVHLDRLSKQGNKNAYELPRPLRTSKKLEYSFSGLKTAVHDLLLELNYKPHIFGPVDASTLPKDQVLFDLCASIQEAIVDSLMEKILLAVKTTQAQSVAIVGGVSANSRLRERLTSDLKVPTFYPNLSYCTDNAAMIGSAGMFHFIRKEFLTGESLLSLNAVSS
jgi:N6-L-threonylcarbamoyladenine synthase